MASKQLTSTVPDPFIHSHHRYGNRHSLNTLDVFLPRALRGPRGYWLVYIHGGAWRDPEIDSKSLIPALHHLDPSQQDIAGIASINYGLSPYPSHPTKPSSPDDPARNNQHPDHLLDVLEALSWLQSRYGFGDDYLLAGHSCGATLAYQAMFEHGLRVTTEELSLHTSQVSPKLPSVVVGLEGIYNIPLLVSDYKDVPYYREFIEAAFGMNEEAWQRASPASWSSKKTWPEGRLAILGHSYEDELVSWNQTEDMEFWLEDEENGARHLVVHTKGKHDDIWRNGEQLAMVLMQALTLTKHLH